MSRGASRGRRTGRISLRGLALGLGMVLALAACGRREPPPDVLLVTIDTLRPDALGWVAGHNATPVIDALAKEGFAFAGAVSPVPLTLPAHTSLLTGLDPPHHGVRDNGHVLGATPVTLADLLRQKGYSTAAFVSGYPLRSVFGLARGFDHYDDRLGSSRAGEWLDRSAADTNAAALAWLAARQGKSEGGKSEAEKPWFLWVHYYEPHAPYTPPADFLRPGARGAYDGEVALADARLGELRARLAELAKAAGAAGSQGRPLLTVLAGDHGESLGEHGEETHGLFVYDSTVLVPLLFHWPGHLTPSRSPAPARLVDVLPTLCDLLGVPAPAGLDGQSLLPLFRGGKPEVAAAYLESFHPWYGYGWAPLVGLRTAAWKLVEAPRPELYDLAADPGEKTNRLAERREVAGKLAAELKPRMVESTASSATVPADAAALAALGYLSSTTSPPPGTGRLADPKDKLSELSLIDLAESEMRNGDSSSALAILDMILADEPDHRYANLRAGTLLVERGELAEGIEHLQRVVKLDPRQAEASYQLAHALTRAGRVDAAIAEWRRTVELQPGRAVAWSNLGAVLLRKGQGREAVEAFERAVREAPDSAVLVTNLAEACYRLALVEAEAGHRDAARQALDKAVKVNPQIRQRAALDPRLAPLLVTG